jgi:hypothetical protein
MPTESVENIIATVDGLASLDDVSRIVTSPAGAA